MIEKREDDLQPITDADAAWLIERAALLDAMEGAHTNVARLHESAHEAGISPAAFERALQEVRVEQSANRKRASKLSEITRRIFTNFLPGWLTTLIVPPLLFKPSTFLEIGPVQIGLITIAAAAAVTGHALASLLLRSRHRTDARMADRVSFVVGALVPVAFVALQITGVVRSPLPYDKGAYLGRTCRGAHAHRFWWRQARRVSPKREARYCRDRHDGASRRTLVVSRGAGDLTRALTLLHA